MATETPSKGEVKEKGRKKGREGGRESKRVAVFEIF